MINKITKITTLPWVVILSALLLCCVQTSFAHSLQTVVAVNHITPSITLQSEQGQSAVTSIDINAYGQLHDVNHQDQQPTVSLYEQFEEYPFVYGSGYYDPESDMQYMGARYYSADIGRFIAQDSYDLINRYNYANANPIMYIDPDGHFAWEFLPDTWGGAIGMMAGIAIGAIFSVLTGGSSELSLGQAIFAGAFQGAASGASGDILNQGFDKGWDKLQWKQITASAIFGAAIGALSSGLSVKKRIGDQNSISTIETKEESVKSSKIEQNNSYDSNNTDAKSLDRKSNGSNESWFYEGDTSYVDCKQNTLITPKESKKVISDGNLSIMDVGAVESTTTITEKPQQISFNSYHGKVTLDKLECKAIYRTIKAAEKI